MSLIALAVGLVSAAIWAFLLMAHGLYWLADQTDQGDVPEPADWPEVAVVVPARDEADVIARSIGSLLAQDYPGPFAVFLVDDSSSDGTADAARAAAQALGRTERLEVITGRELPDGWTGKLWAMSQGVAAAGRLDPRYLLLTDADIAHEPDNLRRLVSRAEHGEYVLTSLMAELHCKTLPERLLIPAFVLFFQMVYPFRQVNEPKHPIAGAYAQLDYSVATLVGTLMGLGLVFLAPPMLMLFASGFAEYAGIAGWVAMTISYQPMLHFYRRSPLWGFLMPVIGALYAAFTLQSAIDVWRGRGAMWKGRAQARAKAAA
jgi:glycosyltransferase involved in cell wall biosynthesis